MWADWTPPSTATKIGLAKSEHPSESVLSSIAAKIHKDVIEALF